MRTDNLMHRPATNPKLWLLDPKITFLNHGSFGSCPRAVLKFQQSIRERMEAEPISFFVRDLESLLDKARIWLADFVGANPENVVFVANATAGINTVLRSLKFEKGDELLTTDHEYNACRNALSVVARNSGAKVVVAGVPFPFQSEDQLIEPILAKITRRTRLLLIDHVTSQTGVIMPLQRILEECNRRGIDTLVDGAHAPGMIPLDLNRLQPTYYTGNCHKWICSPKSAAFLYVQKSRQARIRPLSISHGANSPRTDRSRFLIEFGWTGTWDPSAMLSVRRSIDYIESLLPGGWERIMRRNRDLAVAGRKALCDKLGIAPPCPDQFLGSLASVPLPDSTSSKPSKSPLYLDPLQEKLMKRARIEVPIIPWPFPPKRLLRISAQLYNSLPQYHLLASELSKILARE
jgi:isopenicillin-N epimerase